MGGNNIVPVPRHDGLHVDMVNESIKGDYNITCGEISKRGSEYNIDEDSNTTCEEDSNTTCDEDSNITCE